ncbi:MAG TPA: hypothetical protein PKK59_06940 [Anaerolineaceae bacterium]|nr:hypothetical protein [Anaerolineaceae bacterium]
MYRSPSSALWLLRAAPYVFRNYLQQECYLRGRADIDCSRCGFSPYAEVSLAAATACAPSRRSCASSCEPVHRK